MAKREKYINNIEGIPAQTSEAVRAKMEYRAIRAVKTIEHRAARAVRELLERQEEYTSLIDERVEQMKERYHLDRGVDKRVTAAQNSANVIKKDITAASTKMRGEIDDRVRLFKDGVAIMRIEVDAEILNTAAACSFVDKIYEHALKTTLRIDGDLAAADARMRQRVDNLEYVY
jgi:hypothetical protein